ncbi:MAG: TonB-dependent receptor [Bacteroidota bacterium]
MERENLSTRNKALYINLNNSIYGSFAEIGAGQEVARNFFQAGGASGTIAKTISAYDMTFSDSLYGKSKTGRYVDEERLTKMLNNEYQVITDLLCAEKNNETRYFAYSNTVAAINFKKDNYSHGWMGMKFQLEPNSEPNEILVHVGLLEKDNLQQQQTIGILGVNLIYACYYYWKNIDWFIKSLLDELSIDRVEINTIRIKGPQFENVDNRLLSVKLVKFGMTDATVFDSKGNIQMPADMLYKKNVLALRGSFRPITYVGIDMMKTGFSLFKKDVAYTKENTVVLSELTLNNLLQEGEVDEQDFLDRADILCGMGQNVMISNFREYYKLASYFSRFKIQELRLVTSSLTLVNILDENYYSNLKGGILEAFGALFLKNVKLYIYPALQTNSNELLQLNNIKVNNNLKLLLQYLIDNKKLVDINNANIEKLSIFSHVVLQKIKNNEADWEEMVPMYIAEQIKLKKLFGYNLKESKTRKIGCKKH